MSNMPKRNDALENDALEGRLSRDREITITVTGRKSGRTISLPIWFVWDDGRLYLLPVKGSDTHWYKNVLSSPSIRIDAGGTQRELKVVAVTDATQVKSVIEKLRDKYGANEVKKYYSKLDVAVVAQVR
jgi:deazaflavin-dependent oxidoreductase (nitroreductase family)